MKSLTTMTGILCLSAILNSAKAATIMAATSIIDNSGGEITEWRTATTTKSADIDGDNIYGTFGGIAFGDAVFGAMTYIGAQNQVGNAGSGYVVIDDVTIGDPDRMVRTTTNNGIAGTNIVMYTFQLNTSVESWEVLRVGIVTDGLNGAQLV